MRPSTSISKHKPFSQRQFDDLSRRAALHTVRHDLLNVKDRPYTIQPVKPVKITIEVQGELFKIVSHCEKDASDIQPTPRGRVENYSKKSRVRNLQHSARLDWIHHKAIFVTLTYSACYPNPRTAKLQLRAFLKRLWREVGKPLAVWWRLEFQRRGAPHFHLIIFDLPYVKYELVKTWWREVTGDDSIEAVQINLLDSSSKARMYVSKYTAKNSEHTYKEQIGCLPEGQIGLFNHEPYLSVGRYWGIENRDQLPYCEQHLIEICAADVDLLRVLVALKRYGRKYYRRLGKWYGKGFFLFINCPVRWLECCNHILIDQIGEIN